MLINPTILRHNVLNKTKEYNEELNRMYFDPDVDCNEMTELIDTLLTADLTLSINPDHTISIVE